MRLQNYTSGISKALTLGLASFVLNCLAASTNSVFCQMAAAVILYFSVLFLPSNLGLFSLLIFTTSFLNPTVSMIETVRISIFALGLSLMTDKQLSIPPFITTLLMWALLLICHSPLISPHFPGLFVFNEDLMITISFEITFVLVITLMRASRKICHYCGFISYPISTKTFFLHVITLVVGFCVITILWTSLELLDTPWQSIFAKLSSHKDNAFLILLSIALVPVVVALLLSNIVNKFLLSLNSIYKSEISSTAPVPIPINLAELTNTFDSTQTTVRKSLNELRKAIGTISHLNDRTLPTDKLVKICETTMQNVIALLEHAPSTTISCSSNGIIIDIRKRLAEVIDNKQHHLIGSHFQALLGEHPWTQEIVALLTQAQTTQKASSEGKVISLMSSQYNNYCLEMIAKCLSPTEIPQSDNSIIPHVAIILYLRKIPDLRPLQKGQLIPSRFEVTGLNSAALSRQTNNYLSTVMEHSKTAIQELNVTIDSSGMALCQTNAGINIGVAIREIENITRKASLELIEAENWLKSAKPEQELIDIEHNIKIGLEYLFKLRGLDQPADVLVLAEPYPTGQHSVHEQQDPRILISAPKQEGMRLMSYFLSLIDSILDVTPKIQITVGLEVICAETAAILVGLKGGTYARVMIEHPGQSITENMIGRKYHSAPSESQQSNTLDTSISLLQAHTARLGGFLSIQSTAQRETTITIYLPAAQTNVHKTPNHSAARQSHLNAHKQTNGNTGDKVLLIGSDRPTLIEVHDLLEHLGFCIKVQRLDELMDELAKPLEFEGSGFDISHNETNLHDMTNPESIGNQFDVLIINIQQATSDVLRLVQFLESQNPQATTLLVVDAAPNIGTMFAGYSMLKKPLDSDKLTQALC